MFEVSRLSLHFVHACAKAKVCNGKLCSIASLDIVMAICGLLEKIFKGMHICMVSSTELNTSCTVVKL